MGKMNSRMLLLFLLPSRTERFSPALLLLSLGVLLSVSISIPVGQCPDCTRVGRQTCKPASSYCGPCIPPMQEDKEGHCVASNGSDSHPGEDTSIPDLDEQIDYLSSLLAKQQVLDVKLTDTSKMESQISVKNGFQSSTVKSITHGHAISIQHTFRPRVGQTRAPDRGKHVTTMKFPEDALIVLLMSIFIILGVVALIMAAVCCIRMQRESRVAQKVDYPAFPAIGINSSSINLSGDKKLAHSAQMYHYQHQKQQMLSMEKHKDEPKVSEIGVMSEEETEEGDFTVYECPGLAPTGEMEVKNPLFDDSSLQNGGNHK